MEIAEKGRIAAMQAWAGLLVWIAVCFSAATTGALFPVDEWYDQLNKPSWSPPDAVFGPVWTLLYICMAVSAWLVWKVDGFRNARWPLLLFLMQLGLNAAWTWLFFGLHRIDLAFGEILLLLLALFATMVVFFKRNRVAGFLLVPYLAWVGFATALNYQYWQLNP